MYCNSTLCDECSFRCEFKYKNKQCHEHMHPECRKTCGICHKFLCGTHNVIIFNNICVCKDHVAMFKNNKENNGHRIKIRDHKESNVYDVKHVDHRIISEK
jgi:hypothetical protein